MVLIMVVMTRETVMTWSGVASAAAGDWRTYKEGDPQCSETSSSF